MLKNVRNRNVLNGQKRLVIVFMPRKKMEKGLVVIKHTKFDKIRRKIMMFLYGKDYKIIEQYQHLLNVRVIKPKNIIIPKEMKNF